MAVRARETEKYRRKPENDKSQVDFRDIIYAELSNASEDLIFDLF